ncbi:MAG: hypothetical protein JSU95_18410 [Betaproteobacteria bacterium]|nr:MAG: hypothetical protein JSU95_18410 [Betaproteobacteria bacterium]
MLPRRSLPMLVLLLVCTFASFDVDARHTRRAVYPAASFVKVAERAVSMRDAVSRVRQQTGGRVLDAQDRGTHYRIKVLTPQGEVRIFRVDAQTGAIR